MKRRALTLVVVVCLFFTTGCWDRTELNDIALLLGWGMDIQKDGTYLGSAQIVIPSKVSSPSRGGGGGDGQAYFTETATGKSVIEVSKNMQTKISRRLFPGHRKDIYIGEALAKHGVAKILDEYSRNPDVRLRTDVFVVKGATALDLLQTPNELENIPALAALKLHQQIGGLGDVALANFLIDASTQGSSPTLPVMELISNPSGKTLGEENSTSKKAFAYSGRAVFGQGLKLIGYLNADEAEQAFWVKRQLKFLSVTSYVPQGRGTVSLELTKLGSKIHPILQGNHISFSVVLTGKGIVRENNTNLDLTQVKNLQIIQDVLDKETQKQVAQVITKVQQGYQTDIFGFGESMHKKYPYQWKTLKKNWDREFPKADVTTTVDLHVERVGLTGPSLQLQENQIKR